MMVVSSMGLRKRVASFVVVPVVIGVAAVGFMPGSATASTGTGAAAPAPRGSTKVWAGSRFNDLGSAAILLKVNGGKVKLTMGQLVMACTDTSDGSESARAFSASSGHRVNLRRNRFTLRVTATSGGRIGDVTVSGHLGSNGRGRVALNINAVGVDTGTGGVIERCSGRVVFNVRR